MEDTISNLSNIAVPTAYSEDSDHGRLLEPMLEHMGRQSGTCAEQVEEGSAANVQSSKDFNVAQIVHFRARATQECTGTAADHAYIITSLPAIQYAQMNIVHES